MVMPGRNGSTSDYRYGYQGSEKDDEVKGSGNSYTTRFRQYDPRIGRWQSIDPEFIPWSSPYAGQKNNPIIYNDPLGDKIIGTRKEKKALKERGDWKEIKKEYRSLFRKGNKNLDISQVTRPELISEHGLKDIENASIQESSLSGSDQDKNLDHLYHSGILETVTKTFKFDNRKSGQYINTSGSVTKDYNQLTVQTDFTTGVFKKSINKYLSSQTGLISSSIKHISTGVRYDDVLRTNSNSNYSFFLNNGPFQINGASNVIFATTSKEYTPVLSKTLNGLDKINVNSIRYSNGEHVDACNGFVIRLSVSFQRMKK